MAISKPSIKGYELRERVGAGSSGVVYRAYQASVGREVAIKVIQPQYANQPDFVRRFEVEAQLVARLEHPHIVPMFDYWRDPEGAYLVMRWLPGNLRLAIERGVWSPGATARFLDQLAAALAVAHRDNVIHRDIKPENILLDEDENAYLADFSIAKDLSLRNSADTEGISGTPAYLSPEQIRNEPVTPRTDIYSLGHVIYELLTGEKAYRDATTPYDYMDSHLNTPLPSLSQSRLQLPAALDEVLQTATAKDPTQRYATTPRFAAAFRAALPSLSPRLARQPLADPLTERELDVLRLMVTDLTNEQIAERLVLSPGTVKWYVKQIYHKLDTHSRHQAIERAHHLKLVEQTDRTPAPEAAAEIAPVRSNAPIFIQEPLNPYKGLRAFQEADEGDFFGRAAIIEQLLNRLSEPGDGARFLAVVGASGSGKSSLIKAGLLPALRHSALASLPHPFIAEMMPGSHPLEELEAALLRTAVNPLPGLIDQLREDRRGLVRAAKRILPADPDTELFLVIDQFEELFVLVEDEAMRAHFINNLLSAASDPRGRIRIILTLRADFYDRPLLYPRLAELVRSNTEVVVPLNPRELEQAIIAPAERSGVHLETGLTATIINDVGEQPGMLPLLQYALTELFERREGLTLTLDAYHATGGVSGALTRRANDVYQQLDAAGQRLAQQVFLRLVTLGEGTEDTRRRTLLLELTSLGTESMVEDVISAFADYRLLTLDRDPLTHTPTVEIAHEALVREWSQLLDWLTANRDDIRLQRRLAQAAGEWNAGGDRSFLASGARLTQFETGTAESDLVLTTVERAYLDASLAERWRTEQVDQERQAHEQHLEHRARIRLRALVVVLLLATLGAFGLTGVAVNQGSVAQSNFQRAEAQRLAAEANRLLLKEGSGTVAGLLAIRSLNLVYTPEGDEALNSALMVDYPVQEFVGHTDRVKAVDYSSDGRYVLTGSGDSTVRLWDAQTGQEIRQFSGDMQDINTAAFSPDGQQIITGSRHDHTVRIWDVETGEELQRFSEGNSGSFSLDGRSIFTYSEDDTHSTMIDLATGDVIATIQAPQVARRPEQSGFSPDGTLYADIPDVGDSLTVTLRKVGSDEAILSFPLPIDYNNFDFSNDNHYFLMVNGEDNSILVWDLTTGDLLHTLIGHSGGIASAVFSPDSTMIASGGEDHTVRVWEIESGQEIARFSGHTQAVRIVNFSSDGHFVISGGFDQRALLWEIAPLGGLPRFAGENSGVRDAVFSPDGSRVVAVKDDGQTVLWDAQTGSLLQTLQVDDQPLYFVRVTPDGSLLVTSTFDDNTRVWDMSSGEMLYELPPASIPMNISADSRSLLYVDAPQDQPGELVLWDLTARQEVQRYALAAVPSFALFAPSGKVIAAFSYTDYMLRVYDARTGETKQRFDLFSPHNTGAVAFSPDSRLLFGGGDANAWLWDVETGEPMQTFIGHRETIMMGLFSRDGKTIVTNSDDGTIRFWEAATGREIRRITLPYIPISAALSPDEQFLLVVGSDFESHQLYANLDDAENALCSRLLRDFTPEEREQYEIKQATATCPQFA